MSLKDLEFIEQDVKDQDKRVNFTVSAHLLHSLFLLSLLFWLCTDSFNPTLHCLCFLSPLQDLLVKVREHPDEVHDIQDPEECGLDVDKQLTALFYFKYGK